MLRSRLVVALVVAAVLLVASPMLAAALAVVGGGDWLEQPLGDDRKLISPVHPLVQYVGRVGYPENGGSAVHWDWSGVQAFLEFNGTSIGVQLADNGNQYNAFVDDGATAVLVNTTTGNQTTVYMVADGTLQGGGARHTLQLTKRTEALFGIVTFGGFVVDADATVFALPPRPARRIEFVGDSITCGFGNLGVYGCDTFGPNTEDNWLSWAPQTAAALGADYSVVAWSGKGLVRNYGSANTTSPDPMPYYYLRSVANNAASQWNFTATPVDAVVVNLGTNDYSTQPAPSQAVFLEAYRSFLGFVRAMYNNNQLPIFVVCGPMIGDPCCQYVQQVAVGEHAITYVDMQGLLSKPSLIGCDGHPSAAGDTVMAKLAAPAIANVLGWQ